MTGGCGTTKNPLSAAPIPPAVPPPLAPTRSTVTTASYGTLTACGPGTSNHWQVSPWPAVPDISVIAAQPSPLEYDVVSAAAGRASAAPEVAGTPEPGTAAVPADAAVVATSTTAAATTAPMWASRRPGALADRRPPLRDRHDGRHVRPRLADAPRRAGVPTSPMVDEPHHEVPRVLP